MDLPLPGLPLRDPVSSLTHLAACPLAAYAALLLRRLAGGDRAKRASLAVFGASAVALYAAVSFNGHSRISSTVNGAVAAEVRANIME